MRDDGAWDMVATVGMVKTCLVSGHILKGEPIGFADRLNVDYEKDEQR